jgi:uncharacterized protein YdhG (YjbR/CyaY superfamily)
VAEYLPTHDGRPLKTQDAMLEHIDALHKQRRSAIRVCTAYTLAFPELKEHMDWILAALEVTEMELSRA